jgi:hypothetical protein
VESQHCPHSSPRRSIFGLALLACVLAASSSGCSGSKRPQPKGRLEFHILATEADDKAAVDAARQWFEESAKDPARGAELQKLAQEGAPPPVPNIENGPRYAWVEIAPPIRRGLNLGAKAEKAVLGRQNWKRAAEARADGTPITLDEGFLVWSRDCQSAKLTAEDRAQKKYDYFLLTRLTEPDALVTGEHFDKVTLDRKRRAVIYSLDKTGGERIQQLTEKNKGRYLVAVLDGQIVFETKLLTAIGSTSLINGFTEQELERFAELLGAEVPKK